MVSDMVMTTVQLGMLGVDNVALKPARKRKTPKSFDDKTCVGRFLQLGAGVQSSALVYMVLEGDLPRPDVVLFADTGDEPRWVYDQADYLMGLLREAGIPFVEVRKSEGGLVRDAMEHEGRFVTMPLFTIDPKTKKVGQVRRQCTSEYKIGPLEDYEKNWMIAHGHGKVITDKRGRTSRRISRKVYIENWYGISLDEFERSGSGRGPGWQKETYYLIDRRMSRKDCVQYAVDHKYRVPKKSSCVVCPFHDDNYWLDLLENYPPVFEKACVFDDWIRSPEAAKRFNRSWKQAVYLHRSCKPLREVDFKGIIAGRVKLLPLLEMCGPHCNA